MRKKSELKKSEKKTPKLCCQSGRNGKPGRLFVRLGEKKQYLGYGDDPEHPPVEVALKYGEAVKQWQKNGCKPIPTHVKTGITCEVLAIKYMKWAEVEYRDSKSQYYHCRVAAQLLIDHCGDKSVDHITKHTIIALQEQLVENGKARPYIDRYIGLIKAIFAEGEYRGWGVSESAADSVSRVRNLKKGKTPAPEYSDVDAIDDEIVVMTLPFMNATIRAMVQIQRICCMRGQDVRNLRLHDIDRNSYEVWIYCPFKHKGTSRGKVLTKGIPKAKIREVSTLQKFLLESGQLFSKRECQAYFKHYGYTALKR